MVEMYSVAVYANPFVIEFCPVVTQICDPVEFVHVLMLEPSLSAFGVRLDPGSTACGALMRTTSMETSSGPALEPNGLVRRIRRAVFTDPLVGWGIHTGETPLTPLWDAAPGISPAPFIRRLPAVDVLPKGHTGPSQAKDRL